MGRIDQDKIKVLECHRQGQSAYEMTVQWITGDGSNLGTFTLSWLEEQDLVNLANSQSFDQLTVVLANFLVNANNQVKNALFDSLPGQTITINTNCKAAPSA